ncbi:40S ribosomal protein S21 isoform X2 [Aquila chrysaetos chrysaetos]|uniref:40S ribosomal protein S21 isoform X2 n=1 Tax=Aquila chrysaetos chrysaetos TaxID=223781 RepID=UPI001B7D3A8F|nr:40S ribosomal protein S21 isoform X2 [Aquila chrysaetos chrysaetos]
MWQRTITTLSINKLKAGCKTGRGWCWLDVFTAQLLLLRRGTRFQGIGSWRLRLSGKPNEMQNDAGEFVDLYVPRKCSASNRIIGAKDHASIQINISEVDKVTGRVNGQFKTYAICGAIRRMLILEEELLWG